MNRTKVYILGAGCSVCGDYPIANGIPNAFQTLLNDCQLPEQAKKWVTQTKALLTKHGVETVDQLAEKLPLSEPEVLREAKLATSVLFLHYENGATKRAASQYSRLFQVLFGEGTSSALADRMKNTTGRVLSFNYDRLFERCFADWCADQSTDPVPELPGIDIKDTRVELPPSGFGILKLHGSVGQFNKLVIDHDLGFHYEPEWKKRTPELGDIEWIKNGTAGSLEPTMFFPIEKELNDARLESRAKESPFMRYQKNIWKAARDYCAAATEIHILGYSMQPIDWFSFKTLIEAASQSESPCNRIVISNFASEEKWLVRKLESLQGEYSARWKIEFRSEQFFANAKPPPMP